MKSPLQSIPVGAVRLALAALFASLTALTPVAVGGKDHHIYCKIKTGLATQDTLTTYYSAVFLGDYSQATYTFEPGFAKYVREELGGEHGEQYCFFEDTPGAASRALERHIRGDETLPLEIKIVRTNWAPDNFSSRAIQDFHMELDDDSGEIQVCMRDHECEDGDRVRVSVNGSRMLEGEIFNEWECDSFQAQAGSDYAIELYAINGTGRKGNCNYANANTGELRVSGSNIQTQSWEHRGGAGSRARIIVSLSEQAKSRREQQSEETGGQEEAGGQSGNSSPSKAGANSCKYANDGECDEPEHCARGTDTNDCRPRPAPSGGGADNASPAPSGGNTSPAPSGGGASPAPSGAAAKPAPKPPASNEDLCEFANDGECDEPHFCDPGTDGNDCN